MISQRKQILQWFYDGHINRDSLDEALRLVSASPSSSEWRNFIDRLLLAIGAIFMAAGVVFFFAFNWNEMSRFAKFGLVEGLVLITLAFCWKLGLDRLSGKVTLLGLTILLGALLALVGQTYQTGADPWELFATWVVMALPWVVVGRFSALLLFWLGLVNLAVILYYQAFPRFFGWLGVLFATETLLWTLFVVNVLSLCLWEIAERCRVEWLSERWALRILALVGGGLITSLAVWGLVDFRGARLYNLLGYVAWLAAVYVFYRHKVLDLFVLAGGVLSVTIVVAAGLGKLLLSHGDSSIGMLLIGMTVIALSAGGGIWLKSVSEEGA